ncbi:MAG: hypothetical protein WBD72_00205 [Candidatus Acidiferrum sp.]
MRERASEGWTAVRSVGKRTALICAALCGLLSLAASSAVGQDKSGVNVTVTGKDGSQSAGLVISAEATAKEAGLPLYPGAKPSKEDGDGSSSANLGLWGSSFGFKLVVLKMESNDSPEKVAAFYQKALAKYGHVLNCSDGSKAENDKDKDESSKKLTCADDHPEPGGLLFKVGTKEKRHIVSVKPNGTGSIFHLVYLESRGEEKTPA